eukprot:359969-Chlamydomonas_euryale.AAC.1
MDRGQLHGSGTVAWIGDSYMDRGQLYGIVDSCMESWTDIWRSYQAARQRQLLPLLGACRYAVATGPLRVLDFLCARR